MVNHMRTIKVSFPTKDRILKRICERYKESDPISIIDINAFLNNKILKNNFHFVFFTL